MSKCLGRPNSWFWQLIFYQLNDQETSRSSMEMLLLFDGEGSIMIRSRHNFLYTVCRTIASRIFFHTQHSNSTSYYLKLGINSILLSSILLTTYQLRLGEFLHISSKPNKIISDGLFSDPANLTERRACSTFVLLVLFCGWKKKGYTHEY